MKVLRVKSAGVYQFPDGRRVPDPANRFLLRTDPPSSEKADDARWEAIRNKMVTERKCFVALRAKDGDELFDASTGDVVKIQIVEGAQ